MIGKLTGLLDETADGIALVDVGGVGYEVACSERTLRALPGAGEKVSLSIETVVREDAIKLYGFLNTSERDCFRQLQTVQGVGAKVALSILGVLEPAQLAEAVAMDDKKRVALAPGVGPRMAQRIVAELNDRLPFVAGATDDAALGPGAKLLRASSAAEDAVSALTNLGYPEAQAQNAVASVSAGLEDAGTEELIRRALKELAR